MDGYCIKVDVKHFVPLESFQLS